MKRIHFLLAVAILAVGGAAFAKPAAAGIGDMYPLDTCPVSGKKLGSMGDPHVYPHEGREIRFCCEGCVDKFKADSAAYLKKIGEAIVKQQTPRYPLETCVVSDEKLGGDMGDPVDHVAKNRLVRFCCRECIKKFKNSAATFLAKLDEAAIVKQKETYPLKTCVVSAEKFGGDMGDPVDAIFGGRLVRFCCKDCIKDFRKNPGKYTSKLDGAGASGKEGHEGHKHKD